MKRTRTLYFAVLLLVFLGSTVISYHEFLGAARSSALDQASSLRASGWTQKSEGIWFTTMTIPPATYVQMERITNSRQILPRSDNCGVINATVSFSSFTDVISPSDTVLYAKYCDLWACYGYYFFLPKDGVEYIASLPVDGVSISGSVLTAYVEVSAPKGPIVWWAAILAVVVGSITTFFASLIAEKMLGEEEK